GEWRNGWLLTAAGWASAALINGLDVYRLPESLKAAWLVTGGPRSQPYRTPRNRRHVPEHPPHPRRHQDRPRHHRAHQTARQADRRQGRAAARGDRLGGAHLRTRRPQHRETRGHTLYG